MPLADLIRAAASTNINSDIAALVQAVVNDPAEALRYRNALLKYAVQIHQQDGCGLYAETILKVLANGNPQDFDVLHSLINCLTWNGKIESEQVNGEQSDGALALSHYLTSIASSLPNKILAEHLYLKSLTFVGADYGAIAQSYANLKALLAELCDSAEAMTWDQAANAVGALFWVCGYFEDDPASCRELVNRVGDRAAPYLALA